MSKKHVKAIPGAPPPKPKKKGQLTDIEQLALEKQQVHSNTHTNTYMMY
jgi:hypothetical protein